MHIKATTAHYESLQRNPQCHSEKKDSEKLYLPVHVDKAGAYSMLYGRSSWAGIQRHRFTA